MKKIFVGGNVMSGKNVLRKILDGHPNLLCNHIHDMLGNLMLSDAAKIFFLRNRHQSYLSIQPYLPYVTIKYKSGEKAEVDIGDFFYALYHFCDYKSLHKFAEGNTLYIKSKEGLMERVPFSFDFKGFENTLKGRLFSEKKTFSAEEVMDVVYFSYEKNWMNKQYHEKDYWFVDTLPNGIGPIKNVISNLPKAKIIVMDRDPISLFFANAVRIRSYYNAGEEVDNQFRMALFNQKQFINKIRMFKDDLTELQKNNKNIFVVDFGQAMLDTEKTMKDVSRFLGIDYMDILSKPSICGEILNNIKYPIIGQINDDPNKFLNQLDIDLLSYLYYGIDRENTFLKNVAIITRAFKWCYLKTRAIKLKNSLLPNGLHFKTKNHKSEE